MAGSGEAGQSLPRSVAAAIVEVVATDFECRKVIPDASLYAAAQRLAGFMRNKVNQSAEMVLTGLPDVMEGAKDATDVMSDPMGAVMRKVMGTPAPPRQVPADLFASERKFWEKKGLEESCTEIANVTFRAIDRQAGKGRMTWVTGAGPVDRYPAKGGPIAYHTATYVEVGDGRRYVFDWHATLLARNPVIYRNIEDFVAGRDDQAVLFGVFHGSRRHGW